MKKATIAAALMLAALPLAAQQTGVRVTARNAAHTVRWHSTPP